MKTFQQFLEARHWRDWPPEEPDADYQQYVQQEEDLAELNREAANCGLQTETRPYQPHITLARHARYLPSLNIDPVVWRAESFCLVESCSEPGGVNYKVRRQWPFTSRHP